MTDPKCNEDTALWCKQNFALFAHLMIEEKNKGGLIGNTFKPTSWDNILAKLRRQTGVNFQIKQLKDKFQ